MSASSRILLICDDEELGKLLREKLTVEGGYSISSETVAREGLAAFKQNIFDIVITKFDSFDASAKEFVKELKKIDSESVIIAVLAKKDEDISGDLSRAGLYDFITKPVNLEKLFFLIAKGTELHTLMVSSRKITEGLKEHNVALERQNILLAKRIEDSTKNLTRLYEDLRSTYMRTIKVLAQAIDARDHYTHSHSENVARYAALIAQEMNLSAKETETVREACELHDLGKIGIVDSILTKPGALNDQEWEEIKKHPVIGARILEPLTFLNDVVDLVRQHHEHYDGKGYPEGRKGEDILLGARIINLADAYESMRSARSYRMVPLTKEEAILEVKLNSGKQFDPKVVEAFLRIVDKL